MQILSVSIDCVYRGGGGGNIQKLHVLLTVYVCVLYGSENKQPFCRYTA